MHVEVRRVVQVGKTWRDDYNEYKKYKLQHLVIYYSHNYVHSFTCGILYVGGIQCIIIIIMKRINDFVIML